AAAWRLSGRPALQFSLSRIPGWLLSLPGLRPTQPGEPACAGRCYPEAAGLLFLRRRGAFFSAAGLGTNVPRAGRASPQPARDTAPPGVGTPSPAEAGSPGGIMRVKAPKAVRGGVRHDGNPWFRLCAEAVPHHVLRVGVAGFAALAGVALV